MNSNKTIANAPNSAYAKKIIQLCFDSKSLLNYSTGLKMIYVLNDPPLFIEIKEKNMK